MMDGPGGLQLHPRAILLDLDGTLADSLPVLRLAYRRFLEQFGAAASNGEFESINGPPLAEIVRTLKAAHGLEEDEKVLLDSYLDGIERIYANVAPSPGAGCLLQKARANGCTIGIVTSNSAKRAWAWLEAVNYRQFVDFIVSGDQVTRGKPDPEPYRLASERASHPPSTIVAVEDSIQGARSAVGAGLKTYAVAEGAGPGDSWPAGVELVPSLGCLATRLWQHPRTTEL
jgi:HAD superfamily hydrolase (TIGR01509 family)